MESLNGQVCNRKKYLVVDSIAQYSELWRRIMYDETAINKYYECSI